MTPTKQPDSLLAAALDSAASTIVGPAPGIAAASGPSVAAWAAKQAGTQALAAAIPGNPLKAADHGLAAGHAP